MTVWEEQAWSQKAGAPKSLLPKNYLSPDRSGLKTTVGKGPSDTLQLDLHECLAWLMESTST